MCEIAEYISTFQELGKLWIMKNDVIENLEKFTCEIYGTKNTKSIDICRHDWLRLGCKSKTVLPPNQDCLFKHMQRANYQTGIYRRSLVAKISAPSPVHHGWKISDDVLEIDWMVNEPVPRSLLQQIHCKCKKTSCEKLLCTCRASNLLCTELCFCYNCNNCNQTDVQPISDSDDDEFSE